jgi:hypothetical protein
MSEQKHSWERLELVELDVSATLGGGGFNPTEDEYLSDNQNVDPNDPIFRGNFNNQRT